MNQKRLSRTRLILNSIGAVGLLAVIAYFGIGYVIYDKLSAIRAGGGANAVNTPANFEFRTGSRVGYDTTPYHMAEYEVVRIPSREAGLTLAGWYIPGEADKPAIVLTHGINSCKCSPDILITAGMLHKHGFNVLAYDLRNHGESDSDGGRTAIGNNEYLDVLGAWDWLQTAKGFAPGKIGLVGNSLGAGTTLIAFSMEPQVPAAFVDSPYSDLPQIIDEELQRNNYPTFLAPGGIFLARVVAGDDLLAHSPADAIRQDNGRPLFIVHGTGDTRISVRHTQQLQTLAQQTGANLTVWMPEGIEHVVANADLPAEYEQHLVEFFTAALDQ